MRAAKRPEFEHLLGLQKLEENVRDDVSIHSDDGQLFNALQNFCQLYNPKGDYGDSETLAANVWSIFQGEGYDDNIEGHKALEAYYYLNECFRQPQLLTSPSIHEGVRTYAKVAVKAVIAQEEAPTYEEFAANAALKVQSVLRMGPAQKEANIRRSAAATAGGERLHLTEEALRAHNSGQLPQNRRLPGGADVISIASSKSSDEPVASEVDENPVVPAGNRVVKQGEGQGQPHNPVPPVVVGQGLPPAVQQAQARQARRGAAGGQAAPQLTPPHQTDISIPQIASTATQTLQNGLLSIDLYRGSESYNAYCRQVNQVCDDTKWTDSGLDDSQKALSKNRFKQWQTKSRSGEEWPTTVSIGKLEDPYAGFGGKYDHVININTRSGFSQIFVSEDVIKGFQEQTKKVYDAEFDRLTNNPNEISQTLKLEAYLREMNKHAFPNSAPDSAHVGDAAFELAKSAEIAKIKSDANITDKAAAMKKLEDRHSPEYRSLLAVACNEIHKMNVVTPADINNAVAASDKEAVQQQAAIFARNAFNHQMQMMVDGAQHNASRVDEGELGKMRQIMGSESFFDSKANKTKRDAILAAPQPLVIAKDQVAITRSKSQGEHVVNVTFAEGCNESMFVRIPGLNGSYDFYVRVQQAAEDDDDKVYQCNGGGRRENLANQKGKVKKGDIVLDTDTIWTFDANGTPLQIKAEGCGTIFDSDLEKKLAEKGHSKKDADYVFEQYKRMNLVVASNEQMAVVMNNGVKKMNRMEKVDSTLSAEEQKRESEQQVNRQVASLEAQAKQQTLTTDQQKALNEAKMKQAVMGAANAMQGSSHADKIGSNLLHSDTSYKMFFAVNEVDAVEGAAQFTSREMQRVYLMTASQDIVANGNVTNPAIFRTWNQQANRYDNAEIQYFSGKTDSNSNMIYDKVKFTNKFWDDYDIVYNYDKGKMSVMLLDKNAAAGSPSVVPLTAEVLEKLSKKDAYLEDPAQPNAQNATKGLELDMKSSSAVFLGIQRAVQNRVQNIKRDAEADAVANRVAANQMAQHIDGYFNQRRSNVVLQVPIQQEEQLYSADVKDVTSSTVRGTVFTAAKSLEFCDEFKKSFEVKGRVAMTFDDQNKVSFRNEGPLIVPTQQAVDAAVNAALADRSNNTNTITDLQRYILSMPFSPDPANPNAPKNYQDWINANPGAVPGGNSFNVPSPALLDKSLLQTLVADGALKVDGTVNKNIHGERQEKFLADVTKKFDAHRPTFEVDIYNSKGVFHHSEQCAIRSETQKGKHVSTSLYSARIASDEKHKSVADQQDHGKFAGSVERAAGQLAARRDKGSSR